jgi:hypothetical protein
MIGCRRAVPLFIYTPVFASQLRKSRENLSQVNETGKGGVDVVREYKKG